MEFSQFLAWHDLMRQRSHLVPPWSSSQECSSCRRCSRDTWACHPTDEPQHSGIVRFPQRANMYRKHRTLLMCSWSGRPRFLPLPHTSLEWWPLHRASKASVYCLEVPMLDHLHTFYPFRSFHGLRKRTALSMAPRHINRTLQMGLLSGLAQLSRLHLQLDLVLHLHLARSHLLVPHLGPPDPYRCLLARFRLPQEHHLHQQLLLHRRQRLLKSGPLRRRRPLSSHLSCCFLLSSPMSIHPASITLQVLRHQGRLMLVRGFHPLEVAQLLMRLPFLRC